MKYTLLINQAGVIRCGLLRHVTLASLCVLDYLGAWFLCRNARRVTVEGREFVWLHYQHAVEELPILFNPEAAIRSRKNQLSRIVQGLRDAGLVETIKVGRELYLRLSDLAIELRNSRESDPAKSSRIITPGRDNTITPSHDDTITPGGDGSAPLTIGEKMITETTIRKTLPHGPPKGECASSHKNGLHHWAVKIYEAYPRKVGRPAALRAICRALRHHPPEHLLERTQLFAATYRGELRFIPHPSTWFNQERFQDSPDTWNPAAPSRPGRISPPRSFQSTNYNQPASVL